MKKILCAVLMSLIMSLVMVYAFTENPFVKSTPKSKWEVDKEIRRTLTIVHKHIDDFTGDGKKNCMDYSLLFLYTWNVLAYQRDFEDCDIIINRHGTLNHAFICIYYYDKNMNKKCIYIEPQIDAYGNYNMSNVWGSRYNPKYNEIATIRYVDSFGLPMISLARYFYE